MDKVQGFEVTEYSEPQLDRFAVIKQIASEVQRARPDEAIDIALTGNELRVYYKSTQVLLPLRAQAVEENAIKMIAEFVKHLKKEFKKRTKKDLTLKEIKDRRGSTAQKTSLNERYWFAYWCFYEMNE